MSKLHIKTGDTVMVISGNSKGSKGKVVAVDPNEEKVIIEGVNLVKKHVKPRRQGQAGGIVDAEGAIRACKVNVYCPKCEKGVRVKIKTLENGDKVRACAKCGEDLQ